MSGVKCMSNNAPRAQAAARIVEDDLRQLAEDLRDWPTHRRVRLTELVARAGVLAGRCKRLENRHAATIAAVAGEREDVVTGPAGVEA